MISLDTNLLLYSINRDCPEHADARRFVEARTQRSDVAIAELVLIELYVLLRNPAVVRKPLGAAEAASVCQSFRRHPRWPLIDTAPVMGRVWAADARPDVVMPVLLDRTIRPPHNVRALIRFYSYFLMRPLFAALSSLGIRRLTPQC